jgi:tRNA(fMet)-specific endonuclease VapC
VEAVLGAMTILPFETGADRHYAAIRTALERRWAIIGAHDLLIAAHAHALGANSLRTAWPAMTRKIHPSL